ncbi:putative AB hydrolase-1 domain-containing protein [Seiridium unicorne]|uniref:AB hydrolase-1 domain-containing protein n=1 Tax=Seiridium unicorne TaxID=138068 RepID=A0ABR2UKQ0_9PEZI
MFEGFETFLINTQSEPHVDIYGLKSGDSSTHKPALLLLHGFPQTHHIWHRVAPQLSEKFTVVLLDIRGYGDSSKPEGVSQYAKSVMARDCISVMDQLGFKSKFYICAHDRGARVAHKLIVDHPDRVHKAIFLDICPTLAMYEATDFNFAKAYFHWFFLIQQAPLPETMILSDPRKIAEMFMGGRQTDGLKIFEEEAFEAYVKTLSDPATVHSMCNDYRASATVDMEEARKDLESGKLNKVPLRVLWGKFGVIEKCFNAVDEWKKVSVEGLHVDGYAVESGHYIPEHVPADLLRAIRDFFA